MNSNAQVESLFQELKKIQQNIHKENDPNKIKRLEEYCEELKSNIEELSLSCELDYELMGKAMLFRATYNSLMYRICQSDKLHTIIQELHEMGVPRDVMVSDKEILTRYLRQIEHPNPSKYERYHEFIRNVQSKAYRESPARKRHFLNDFNWMMDKESLGAEIMDVFDINSSAFYKIISDQENENFEFLVERWHKLNFL